MMKKRLLIISLFFLLVLSPLYTKAAAIKQGDTLGDLKNQLKDLQNKKAAQDSKKKQTQAEIDANVKRKNNAEYELEQAKLEVEKIKLEIEKTNSEINDVQAESEDLLRLYQQLESDNIYVEYITGASTMTELIMRMDVISQISDFNQEKLDELELLITNNAKLTKELEKYQQTLDSKIIAYEQSNEVLGDELAKIEEGALTISEEITALKETISSYEKLGCKDDQELMACVAVANNNGWLKPVSKARITSLYGYRSKPTANASSFHRGIDMGVAEKTKAYATAAGTVGAIVRKASCGGNMVYVWAYVGGKPYTYVFMHLYEIDVAVGDKVGVNTVIGLSGGGSTAKKNGGYDTCTTGAHLHYGLASGGFYGTKELPLSKFNSNTMNPPGYPGLYQWFYSR